MDLASARGTTEAASARKGQPGTYLFSWALAPPIKFFDGVDHGGDVVHRCGGLDVVDGVEDEPAAGGQDLHPAEHLIPDLPGRPEGECRLGVDAAAPEDDAVTVSLFEMRRVHPGGRDLDRVEDVAPGLDEGIDQRLDGAAGMLESLPICIPVDPIVDHLVVGEVELGESVDRAELGLVGAQVGPAG